MPKSEAPPIELRDEPIPFTTLERNLAPAIYYVAPDGDDARTGLDREHAWKTNRHAAEKVFAETKSDNALVIGAAGFTFPRDIARLPGVRQVDAVDVDPVVREVAERHFLKQILPPKVRFLPLSARYAVRKLPGHYGFTFIDAYFGKGIPDELVTVEFFRDVRLLSDRMAANVVMDPEMESAFAKNTLASFREAFGRTFGRPPGHSRDADCIRVTWIESPLGPLVASFAVRVP